jgi:ATP-dependent DNA ligase
MTMVCLPAPTTNVPEALATLEGCETTLSVTAKLALLTANRHNPVLRQALELTFDPKANYYLRDATAVQPAAVWQEPLSPDEATVLWQDFVALLGQLSRRELTGNAARDAVRNLLASGDSLMLKWCTRILVRDLRCGFGTTLARRVWPDFLAVEMTADSTPFRGCMLALDLKKVPGGLAAVLQQAGAEGVEASLKLDGFRFTGPCENGGCRLYSRGGQRRPYLAAIEAELAAVFQGWVVDGEVFTDLDAGNWNEVASLVNKTKTPLTPAQQDRLRYYLFDLVPLGQYRLAPTQQTGTTGALDYGARAGMLDQLVAAAKAVGQLGHVETVPYAVCNTEQEIETFYQQALERGFEGLVLKPLGLVPYLTSGDRPPTGWIKLKPTDDETVEILEVLPGTGRNAHRMGAVRVRDAAGAEWHCGLFLTRTAGASDRLRELFWQHRLELPGLQIDVRSQKTKSREGLVKVSFPRIVRIRADLGWGDLGLVGGPAGNVPAAAPLVSSTDADAAQDAPAPAARPARKRVARRAPPRPAHGPA